MLFRSHLSALRELKAPREMRRVSSRYRKIILVDNRKLTVAEIAEDGCIWAHKIDHESYFYNCRPPSRDGSERAGARCY